MSTTPRRPDECVSHARLLEVLAYDPETGVFTWRVTCSRRAKAGSVAGKKAGKGRPIQIGIDGVLYLAHQLAWFYVHGSWAGSEIDHRHGDPSFNAIANLRPATRNGNMQNERKARISNKNSGLLGAYRGKRGRWFALICVNRQQKYLGSFDTAEEAHRAYVEEKRRIHPTCTI